jgi:hypothetical protein
LLYSTSLWSLHETIFLPLVSTLDNCPPSNCYMRRLSSLWSLHETIVLPLIATWDDCPPSDRYMRWLSSLWSLHEMTVHRVHSIIIWVIHNRQIETNFIISGIRKCLNTKRGSNIIISILMDILQKFKGLSWSWSYGSWIYNYLCTQCLSPLTLWVWIPLSWGVLDTILYDKVCQWLATGWWFFLGTLVSSTNKIVCHNITEILLKVVLNTITVSPSQIYY